MPAFTSIKNAGPDALLSYICIRFHFSFMLTASSWFDTVHSFNDLQEQFPGISEILILWLQNYKGKGFVEIEGIGDEMEASNILEKSIKSYRERQTF